MHTVMVSDAKQEHAAIAVVDARPSVMIAKLCTYLAVFKEPHTAAAVENNKCHMLFSTTAAVSGSLN